MYSEAELEHHQPVIVLVDDHNRPLHTKNLKLAR
jgi:aspartate 1-decarboxylase